MMALLCFGGSGGQGRGKMAQGNSSHTKLTISNTNADAILADVLADNKPLELVFQGLSSGVSRVKFGCSKALLLLSQKRPDLLYGRIERIVELLDSENQILKWNAIAILGNLAAVDTKHQIKSHLKKLFGFLACGELITANNAIAALGKIAYAFPDERRRITAQLLGIEHNKFDTDECRNIAIGKAILAIEVFLDPGKPAKSVFDFVRRQMENPRMATAKKAKAFSGKCGLQPANP